MTTQTSLATEIDLCSTLSLAAGRVFLGHFLTSNTVAFEDTLTGTNSLSWRPAVAIYSHHSFFQLWRSEILGICSIVFSYEPTAIQC